MTQSLSIPTTFTWSPVPKWTPVRKKCWVTHYLSSKWWAWLFQEVPEFLPLFGTTRGSKLLSFPLPHVLGLSFELFVHLLLFLVIPGLAAGLKVDLVDAPEVQLLAEWERAHFLHHVQLPSAIEVEDGSEGAGVSVEKVLVGIQAIIIAYLQDRVVGVAVS